jgi:NAD(P)-dependent dehydrogenase (short-subunit alcohol dehydrogenase family)
MAESFAAAGMKLVLSDIERAPLEQTCAQLRAAGSEVHPVVTDVSRPEQVEALADEAFRRYGVVHVLCNNAGVSGGRQTSWSVTLDEWNWVLGVNLMGVIHGVTSFVPRMIAQQTEAHIVNTASLAGLTYSGGNIPYAVSKFGVVALSEGMSFELQRAGFKPKVSVLCPGFVNTNIIDAGRNRPVGVRTGPQPTGPVSELISDWFTKQLRDGLDPRAVGDQVLSAIQEERFYVLTHPEWQSQIAHRARCVSNGENPSLLPPPGIESLLDGLAKLGVAQ